MNKSDTFKRIMLAVIGLMLAVMILTVNDHTNAVIDQNLILIDEINAVREQNRLLRARPDCSARPGGER